MQKEVWRGCARPYGAGCKPEIKQCNGRSQMYELTASECHLVGGGNNDGQAQPQGGSQVCSAIAGGGTQCTSNNGRSMVVQTYDKSGNLTNTTVCTENRDASLQLKLTPQASGQLKSGGGTSCSSQGNPSSGNQGSSNSGQLVIYSPFFYGAP